MKMFFLLETWTFWKILIHKKTFGRVRVKVNWGLGNFFSHLTTHHKYKYSWKKHRGYVGRRKSWRFSHWLWHDNYFTIYKSDNIWMKKSNKNKNSSCVWSKDFNTFCWSFHVDKINKIYMKKVTTKKQYANNIQVIKRDDKLTFNFKLL